MSLCIYEQHVEVMDAPQPYNILVRVRNRAGEEVMEREVHARPHQQFREVMEFVCADLGIVLVRYNVTSGPADLSNCRGMISGFRIPPNQHMLLDMWPKCANNVF